MKKSLIARKWVLCLLLLPAITVLSAQDFSGGFKAGLNFSKFDGPSLVGPDGSDLESHDYATGFHIGVIANARFNKFFGLRGELLYTQKGTEYTYDGDSYLRLFTPDGANSILSFGNRRQSVSITTSYIELPVSAYLRLGRLELHGGVNAAVLISATGAGELAFNGVTAGGRTLDPVSITIDANYIQDEFNQGNFDNPEMLELDNRIVNLPETIGAYYDANDVDENFLNTFDFAVHGGASFYLNSGLFLGFRYSYGFADITQQEQDIDYRSLENGEVVLQDDHDHNVSIQASIGFSF